MRRPVSGSGRLAPLDGGSSRRSGVMRLCSSEQPAHISLIRRRSRSIVSRAPASFVSAGELLSRCELTDKLIEFCQRLVGWIRGGLAHVTVTASMLLSGITGSTLSDAATIAPIMIPSMIKEKYPREFAGALVASASVIGAIIPPSIPLVIIGAQLGISIGGLLVGGILPGIVVGITLMIASYVAARLGGFGAIRRFEGFRPLARSTWIALPVLVIPVLLLGGMMSGIFSPTEAGTVTVLYTIVAGMFFYRTLSVTKLVDSRSEEH